ncbi:MAG: DJ-1/PfpI family protein [Saprospiraceae bacterium]|nr:DJ-1/PfpI family protein [Saprospiraceae bacterium]
MQNKIIVGFPLYDGCTLVDFVGATQVFDAADGFSPIWLSYKPSIKTAEGFIIDFTVQPSSCYSFDDHPPIDLLFVPGGGSDGVAGAIQDKTFMDFIWKTAPNAQWRGSVCTGAFILAAAGILKNCSATTYWSQLATLNYYSKALNLNLTVTDDYYPRFMIHQDLKLFSGGGISSSLDLALSLVTVIADADTAMAAQLQIQYQPSPPVEAGIPAVAPPAIVAPQREGGVSYAEQLINALKHIPAAPLRK